MRSGGETRTLARTSGSAVDEQIAQMARQRLGDVVMMAEGMCPHMGIPRDPNGANAAAYLVSRLFTDAIFNQDVRTIQLIVNRIDGGLPKDVDMDSFRTEFAESLEDVVSLPLGEQLKLKPDDTVMTALCKSLYDVATKDIYWSQELGRRKNPSSDDKRDRDAAMRLVLDRLGGRKTAVTEPPKREEIEPADWIKSLPST